MSITTVILNEKIFNILQGLGEGKITLRRLQNKYKACTTTQNIENIKKLINIGLVTKKLEGRNNIYFLTSKGKKIRDLCYRLKYSLEKINEQPIIKEVVIDKI